VHEEIILFTAENGRMVDAVLCSVTSWSSLESH